MSNIDSLDVLEWAMELRENNIMMDLYNLQIKERKQMEEKLKRQREFEARKDVINQHKEKILDHEKCFKERSQRSTISLYRGLNQVIITLFLVILFRFTLFKVLESVCRQCKVSTAEKYRNK